MFRDFSLKTIRFSLQKPVNIKIHDILASSQTFDYGILENEIYIISVYSSLRVTHVVVVVNVVQLGVISLTVPDCTLQ